MPLAEDTINRYLDTEPVPPLEAYALGLQAIAKFVLGDNEGAEELIAKAEAIDPYYSKAFGVPPSVLFTEPDEICHHHAYFSRLF